MIKSSSILGLTLISLLAACVAHTPQPPAPKKAQAPSKVESNQQALTALQRDIITLRRQLKRMQGEIAGYDSLLSQKTGASENRESRVDTIIVGPAARQADIIELKGRMYVLAREVENLKKTVAELTRARDSLQQLVVQETKMAEKPAPKTLPMPALPQDTSLVIPKSTPSPKAAAAPPSLRQVLSEAEIQRRYQEARDLYRRHAYKEAIEAFRAIIEADSSSSLADNSQYWIGECYYSMEHYPDAIKAFREVPKFPKSNKSDHALFKIALSQSKLGYTDQALETMRELLARYPNSELVTQAQAYLKAHGQAP